MKLPATYIYRFINMDMHFKLLILVGEALERCHKTNKAKSELNTKQKKKKDTLRK